MSKTELPQQIKNEMKMWREGFACFPTSYIDHHLKIARSTLQVLAAQNAWTIHRQYIASDGWLDGMRVLHAIIETKDGVLRKIKYHDGGENWFDVFTTGGATLIPETLSVKV